MKPIVRVVMTLAAVVAFAPRAWADDAPRAGDAQAARDALARLAAAWKEPGDSNGAGLSADDDAVWKIRTEALVTLAKAGPGAVPVLVEALKDGPPASRILAAQALGLFADPATKPALRAALKDGQGQVRLYAIRALSMFGRLEATPEYEAIRDNDGNWRVQVEMAAALKRDDKPDAAALRKQLADFDLKRLDSARMDEAAPDFTLVDSSGGKVSLGQFRGKKAVVLVFRVRDT
jgi:HEAT repeat protein